jgi:hypothetical protein
VSEIHDPSLLTEQLELHLVELPKLEEPLAGNDEPDLVAWGKFLAAATDQDLDELAMSDPVLRQAQAALEKLSADPAARIRAEQRQLALDSYRIDIGEAKAQGRAEGLAEGRAEGRVDMLLRLLALKFGEVPERARARLAAATDAELVRYLERATLAASLADLFDDR